MQAQSTIKYGTIHYDSLLVSLPQYAQVQQRMEELQKKYTPQIYSRIKGEFLRLPFVGRDIRLIRKGV